MSRVINGTLFVPSYNLISPGVYSFSGATFNNQADATGNGALDLTIGCILFIPVLDPNTFMPVPGVVNRYKLTALTVVNPSTIHGTVVYDGSGPQYDEPQSGSFASISEPTRNNDFGMSAAVAVYSDLIPGADVDAITQDFKKISDNLGNVDSLFTNNSGSTINALTLVRQTGAGTIDLVNPSNESEVLKILGLLIENTLNGQEGVVVFKGVRNNISTTFNIGDVLYLSKTGDLTTTIPEIDVGGFVSGDFVIRVGTITKNFDNPSNKDFLVDIQLVGQL